MRQPEQLLWDRLRHNIFNDRHLDARRIENRAAAGDPDLEVIAAPRGLVTKIELKAVRALPARATTPVLGRGGLRPEQVGRLLRWTEMGGRALVVICVGGGAGGILRAVPGREAPRLNGMTWAELNASSVANDYRRLRLVLRTENWE